MEINNKKEDYLVKIDKDVYASFCVACVQANLNVNEVLEDYMVSYVQQDNKKVKTRQRLPEPQNIHLFETWMKERRKPDGKFYAEQTVNAYLGAIKKMCYNENIADFNELIKNIGFYETLYNRGGKKEAVFDGDAGSGFATLNLLKAYAEE